MNISKQTFLILAAIAVYSCNKQAGNNTNQLSSTYTGQLFADYRATDPWRTGPIISNVTVTFANGNYAAETIPVTEYFGAYLGTADSGKYVLQSSQLILIDTARYPQLFDQNLILAGSYSVIIKGDSLILNKTISGNDYTYKLKKD
jgi:hypothetical protein